METSKMSKTQIISEIDKATKAYSEYINKMDKNGIDFSGVTEFSDLCFTLEKCKEFINEHA